MKPNELMIGDWVTFKDCQHENPILIKIIAIGFQADEENDCLVQIDGDKACDIIAIDDEIVGIPLTAEILEKNGWEKDDDGFYEPIMELNEVSKDRNGESIWLEWGIKGHILDVEKEIENRNNGSLSISRAIIKCEFVHELQHALKLCGIEKEIVL